MVTRAPAWALPGAKFDFDFENGRYWGANVSVGSGLANGVIGDFFTADSGSATTYAPNRDGLLIAFPIYGCRITPGMGIWSEAATVNYALWSRDFTNAAWVKTNVTAVKNQIGAENAANAASSLTATAANATVLQSITLASSSLINSAWVKRLSGTGAISMTMDGGTTWIDVTAQIGTGKYLLTWAPIQTVTNPTIGFMIANSGDSIAVDFAQIEKSTQFSYPSTPVPATTAAFPRYNEHLSFWKANAHPNAGQRMMTDVIYAGKPYSYYMKYSGNPVGGGGLTLGTDGVGPLGIANGGADGSGAIYSGQVTSNTGNTGIGNWNKVAGRTNGYGSICCLNGGPLSTYNTAALGLPQPITTTCSHGSIGNNGSGTTGQPLNGPIARFTLWDQEITDGQLQQFTRL